MKTPRSLPQILTAAEQHGIDDANPNHVGGDLWAALRVAWKIMTPAQRKAFLHDKEVVENYSIGVGSPL